MTFQDTTTDQLMLLDDADLTEGDAKSDTAMDPAWLAREAGFMRQVALDKAVQVARVALAHNRVSEAHAADFTVSAAGKFLAFLLEN